MDLIRRALCAGVASLLVTGPAFASPEKPVIGVVVKIGGIPWFNAMDAGIKKKGAELGVKAFMVGPTSADPALQVRAIEDLIAQKVDVIGVVPNDAEVLEPVLERARAVAERHEDGKIVVMGPFSPGQGKKLVHDGVLTGGYMWNPEVAGEVFVTLGTMVAKGEPIKDDTVIPGLGTVHPVGHDLIVDQLVDLNKDTVDDLAKMGL